MATRFDFNCDMGESFGPWKMGLDAEVIRFITSANIACGFHAGDPATMCRTVRLAEAHGVGIGAHPGFPDLQGFGRRNLAATPDEVRDDLLYQIGALTAFTRAKKLQHVKPHGALYNMAVPGGDLARAIGEAVLEADPSLILIVLAGSKWADQAEHMGLRVAREAFADRALMPDGTLVPRSKPGAVIHDTSEVIERSLRLATDKTVVAISGEVVHVDADTLVPARRHARCRLARVGLEDRARGRRRRTGAPRRVERGLMAVEPRFLVAGDAALIVEFGDAIDPAINRRVRGLFLAAEGRRLVGVRDLVPTYRSLLVSYDPLQTTFAALRERLSTSRNPPR